MYLAPACCCWLGLAVLLVEAGRIVAEGGLLIVWQHPGVFLFASVAGFFVNLTALLVRCGRLVLLKTPNVVFPTSGDSPDVIVDTQNTGHCAVGPHCGHSIDGAWGDRDAAPVWGLRGVVGGILRIHHGAHAGGAAGSHLGGAAEAAGCQLPPWEHSQCAVMMYLCDVGWRPQGV